MIVSKNIDFHLLRHDRSFPSHRGIPGERGVCVYLHKSLEAKCIAISAGLRGYPEYMMVKLGGNDWSKVLVCIVYRPPHIGQFDSLTDALTDISFQY